MVSDSEHSLFDYQAAWIVNEHLKRGREGAGKNRGLSLVLSSGRGGKREHLKKKTGQFEHVEKNGEKVNISRKKVKNFFFKWTNLRVLFVIQVIKEGRPQDSFLKIEFAIPLF